jgi:hypothetical protein
MPLPPLPPSPPPLLARGTTRTRSPTSASWPWPCR